MYRILLYIFVGKALYLAMVRSSEVGADFLGAGLALFPAYFCVHLSGVQVHRNWGCKLALEREKLPREKLACDDKNREAVVNGSGGHVGEFLAAPPSLMLRTSKDSGENNKTPVKSTLILFAGDTSPNVPTV